jgi:hypothetical protein
MMLGKMGWLIGLFMFCSGPIRAMERVRDAFGLKIGSMQYQTEGIDPATGRELGFLNLEYAHYWKANLATIAAFRTVEKREVKRNLYQASLLGIRFYPLGLAAPISAKLENNVLEFDSWFKPYLDVSATQGRYLIRVAGNPAVLEASSPFFGFNLTLGVQLKLAGHYALDLSINLERDFGYGSPLPMKATNIITLAGLTAFL